MIPASITFFLFIYSLQWNVPTQIDRHLSKCLCLGDYCFWGPCCPRRNDRTRPNSVSSLQPVSKATKRKWWKGWPGCRVLGYLTGSVRVSYLIKQEIIFCFPVCLFLAVIVRLLLLVSNCNLTRSPSWNICHQLLRRICLGLWRHSHSFWAQGM